MVETLSEEEVKALTTFRRTNSLPETAKALGLAQDRMSEILRTALAKEKSLLSGALGDTAKAETGEEQLPFRYIQRLQLRLEQPQVGMMKVGSQILELLSSGIYSSPENAFKEVLSNSFDADATQVTITTSTDFETITVVDDGEGMDFRDFDDRFTVISRSDKRDASPLTAVLRRPMIGKIGIGFISVSELCDQLRVTSAKRGSDTWFEASIDFSEFRKPESKKKDFYDVSKFVLTNHKKDGKEEHYTKVELMRLKPGFRDLLTDKGRATKPPYSFDGLKSFEAIMDAIDDLEITNIHKEVAGYWRFVLNLAMILPVTYIEDGPIVATNSREGFFRALRDSVESLKFKVVVNGLQLKKPIKLPLSREGIKIERQDFDLFTFDEKVPVEGDLPIRVLGYLYNQKRNIGLEDLLRGIVIRIKNTKILTDPDFLGYPFPEKMHLDWTFGELYSDGLEDAMNVNRSTFRYADVRYQAVSKFLHELVHHKVIPNAKLRYNRRKTKEGETEAASLERRRRKAVRSALGKDYDITYASLPGKYPVLIKSNKIEINRAHEVYRSVKRKERSLLENTLLAVRLTLAKKPPSKEEFWDVFLRILSSLTVDSD